MLDEFLVLASEVSKVLIPVVTVILLIALTVLVFKIIKVINAIPLTMDKVNETLDTTHHSIQKLEVPLDAIIGVSQTVDTVNKSATGIVSNIANFAVDNSDSIVNWTKGLFKKEPKRDMNTENIDEEDFGVYE